MFQRTLSRWWAWSRSGRPAWRVTSMALFGLMFVAVIAAEPPLDRRIDEYVRSYVDAGNFSGVVLVARDGRPVFERAYGLANVEHGVPNRVDTRFQIASVSKAFTAAAILLLEARGRLATTDPVARYVPEFRDAHRITLEHLLTHTSGVPNINDLPGYEVWSRLPQTPSSLVDRIRGEPLDFEPGATYAYSNSNYNLLALVIERVSGHTYGDFVHASIVAPLGLENTGHAGSARAIVPGRADGYAPEGRIGLAHAEYTDWSAKTGNGSLSSTARDLLAFVHALHGDGLLEPRIRQRIVAEGTGNRYGWFVRRRFDRRVISTNGRSPGYTASVDYFPDDRLTIVVLSNVYATTPMAADLTAIVFGEPVKPPRRVIELGDASVLRQHAGHYTMPHEFFIPGVELIVTDRGDHLQMRWSSGAESPLAPLSPTEFLDRSFGAVVRFGPQQLSYLADGREYIAQKRAP